MPSRRLSIYLPAQCIFVRSLQPTPPPRRTDGAEQLSLAVFDPIAVEPTRDVLLRGADTIYGGAFLFAHRHVPARPAALSGDRVWLAMLDLLCGSSSA